MKRVIKRNPRYEEYLEYLEKHITGVKRAWNEMLKPFVGTNYPGVDLCKIDKTIALHDSSKYDDEEFIPYCNYFYPTDNFPKNEEEFDLAWLRHQHLNPHHPQYWVLLRDSGELVALDMPIEYICEMLCDWSSFQYRDPESTANNWYNNNKDKMQLSDNTRTIVEEVLKGCPNL